MKAPNVNRNVFDLSHERKLSCYMGKLIPIMCEEIIPGDFFKTRTSMVVRITPLLAPMMHRVDVFTHFFFVPLRLIWTNFEKFITGGEDGLDATVWPYIEKDQILIETLMDYFGLPLYNHAGGNKVKFSALPLRAYSTIYNQWYRDQNLISEVTVSKGDGADTTTNVDLLDRCWEKDYFTSALPWAQRGASVTLPLGTTAPVTRVSNAAYWEAYLTGTDTKNDATAGIHGDSTGFVYQEGDTAKKLSFDPRGGLVADLSTASAATINALRNAFQVQKWLERNARGGARYVESILAHFGVRSSDARLQRPEFLGGGRSPITVSEVLQTSESGTTPQGTMAGHGFSVQSNHAFEKSFEEHGLVIGIMSIMPRTGYMQGLPRMWSRSSKYDYFWPEFAALGEQAVLSKEIYCDPFTDPADDEATFGYQGRYDEYRRRESTVHGTFRTTLDYWHMARKFAARPTLSSTFVQADPTTRISAVPTAANCLVQVYNDVKAVRPMPLEGIPGGI